jgi:hypothetical protein
VCVLLRGYCEWTVADSLRSLQQVVKTLTSNSRVSDRAGRDAERTERPAKQLAIEGAKGAPEKRAVNHESAIDMDSKPGFIGVGSKWYKRGLLISILTRQFAFKWQEAQNICWSVILSPSGDKKKRHENCPHKHKAGHKEQSDYAHAFTQGAKLLKLHDEEFQEGYVPKPRDGKRDFR